MKTKSTKQAKQAKPAVQLQDLAAKENPNAGFVVNWTAATGPHVKSSERPQGY